MAQLDIHSPLISIAPGVGEAEVAVQRHQCYIIVHSLDVLT